MRGNIISLHQSPVQFSSNTDGRIECQATPVLVRSVPGRHQNMTIKRGHPLHYGAVSLASIGSRVNHFSIKSIAGENLGYPAGDDEDDDELCPVECVREFYTDEEFLDILEKAKMMNTLVVVDFYRTSCGSCKYIEQGFSKLCKASGEDDSPVIFLKHNVMDEYDEQSEVADRLRIRTVPLFHFYKNGRLLEAFATRDKERITEAILRYTSPAPMPQDV